MLTGHLENVNIWKQMKRDENSSAEIFWGALVILDDGHSPAVIKENNILIKVIEPNTQ